MSVRNRAAFTLVELAVALVIVSLMTGFALQAFQGSRNVNCLQTTRDQILTIQKALDKFTFKNQRLPKPALLATGSGNPVFGAEASTGYIAIAASGDNVLMGVVPNATLGLDNSYAADCWGNKFVYAVTEKLTSSDGASGYPGNNTGKITLKTGTLASPTTLSTSIAYVVVSMGPDGFGANPLTVADATIRHCTGSTASRVDRENCDFTVGGNTTFFSNAINTGDTASHFDDLLIYKEKPATLVSNVYCWGLGSNGKNGNGALTTLATPTVVQGGIQFAKLYYNSNSVYGLTTGGKAYGWGLNSGRLGVNINETNTPIPTELAGGLTFRDLYMGDNGVPCGITTSDTAYCWGENTNGQVGDATTNNRSAPSLVAGGLTWSRLSARGSIHKCGITTAGRLYCWGNNTYGQLGNNASGVNVVSTPVQVNGNYTDWVAVDTAQWSTCGIRNAGKLYCWGLNIDYNLGTGNTTNASVPTLVSSAATFVDVNLSVWGGCATTSTGLPYCWGKNGGAVGYAGLAGYGQDSTLVSTPTLVSNATTAGLTKFIAGGLNWGNCGLTSAGAAYCWGHNYQGQTGNGTVKTSGNQSHPTPTIAISGATFSTANNKFAQGGCGIDTASKLWCWGANSVSGTYTGRLGDGSTSAVTARGTAGRVLGDYNFTYLPPILNNACAIVSGGSAGGTNCATTTTSWGTAPNTCTGSIPTLANGGAVVVKDEYSTYQGTITATCNSGSVTLTSATCTPANSCSGLNYEWTIENGGSSTLAHGATLTGYTGTAVSGKGIRCGEASCTTTQLSITCNNGTLSGNTNPGTVNTNCNVTADDGTPCS